MGHHERSDDVPLEEMHDHAEENDEQRSRSSAGTTEDDERRKNRGEKTSEERHDCDKPGEDSERQPVRNSEYVESQRRECAEYRHREQLCDNV